MITSKEQLFDQLAAKPIEYTLDNGEAMPLLELSLGQRNELIKLTQEDPIRAQAAIVTMACPLLADGDVDAVMGLPGAEIAEIADEVMRISGLKTEDVDEDDDEKKPGPSNGVSDTDSPSLLDEQSVN